MNECRFRHPRLIGLWAAWMGLFCVGWWLCLLDTFKFGGPWQCEGMTEYAFLCAFSIGPAVLTERVMAVKDASVGLLRWLRLLRLALGLGGVAVPAVSVPILQDLNLA